MVEVASMFPTVSCEPVAMSAVPAALDVMIELGANEALPVRPLAIEFVTVIVGETLPTTVKDEHDALPEHDADDVDTLFTMLPDPMKARPCERLGSVSVPTLANVLDAVKNDE